MFLTFHSLPVGKFCVDVTHETLVLLFLLAFVELIKVSTEKEDQCIQNNLLDHFCCLSNAIWRGNVQQPD